MISSIGSTTSMMQQYSSVGKQQQAPPPPPEQDVFQVSDTDGDGLVSQTELETLVSGLEEVTGSSIDTEEALASYDSDEDGSLSGEELQGLMNSYGFTPPGMTDSETGELMNMQAPPPPPQSAASAYAQNSGDDMIGQLLEILTSEGEDYSPVDMTA